MGKIAIAPAISLDEDEIEISYVRASGPGGQNVNKVATAAQLRFDVKGSASLSGAVKSRLTALAGRRMTQDGVLVLSAQRYRTQERNREDAMARLCALIAAAAIPPVHRRPTKPTKASKERRISAKIQRSRVKGMRGRVAED